MRADQEPILGPERDYLAPPYAFVFGAMFLAAGVWPAYEGLAAFWRFMERELEEAL